MDSTSSSFLPTPTRHRHKNVAIPPKPVFFLCVFPHLHPDAEAPEGHFQGKGITMRCREPGSLNHRVKALDPKPGLELLCERGRDVSPLKPLTEIFGL